MDVRQREPRNVDGLGIRVALDAELSAGGFQQVVVDDLVDACVRTGEPVVDGAQRGQHASDDPGLLGDFPHRRLFQALVILTVSLGQAPLHPPGPVATCDHRDPGNPLVNVNDQASGRDLLDGRSPAGQPGRHRGREIHFVTVTSARSCPDRARG